ncbi:MAG: endonuclease/exonuclease/phosphatase family protein [Planctomycetota bacterium]|nr:endonuclease/exonuclease/phosphatase family protein [Planctomycetota bacterium]
MDGPEQRSALAAAATAAAAGLAACLLGARLGHLDWRLDLLSHFHVQYAGLALVGILVGAFAGWRRIAALSGLLALYAGLQVSPLVLHDQGPPAAGAPTRVATLNVKTSNQRFGAAAAWLSACAPDVAVVQELDADWMRALEAALDGHRRLPTDTARDDNFGIAVFVRRGLTHGELEVHHTDEGLPWIEAVIEAPSGPLRLFAVHTVPPLGGAAHRARDRQIEDVLARAARSAEPGLVVGDLNATIWSTALRGPLARTSLRPASLGAGLRGSWPAALRFTGGILIDHVLVDERLAVLDHRVGPPVGSDHLGVVVEVAR